LEKVRRRLFTDAGTMMVMSLIFVAVNSMIMSLFQWVDFQKPVCQAGGFFAFIFITN
jgi:hypothetical protein